MTRLKIVCAWCDKTIGYKDGKGVEGTTHGICRKCEKKHLGRRYLAMGLAYHRLFNGNTYTLRTHSHTKAKAREIAQTIRRAGKMARVVEVGGAYAVYAR